MSAFFHGQHLDAFAGREVVFCHNCSHEWYRDTGDLQCPRCTSEATEIVSDRENDPRGNLEERDMDHEPNLHDDGIERQFRRGPGGLFFSRTTYRSPSRHEPGAASGPVHPADPQAILNRFAEMVGDLDPGRSASDGPALAPEAPFARATILRSSFGNGQTGFTITTPPVRVERGGHGAPQDVANDFAMLFGTIMGNITPQAGNSPFGNASNANSANTADRGGVNAGNDMGPGGQQPPHGFPLQFHQLISALFGPAGTANWGDVVTSQQELDRIISNLMEVNPQSNAAPPASQAALDRLERKKLDSTMVGSGERAECTICIDELHRGDEVTVLPCKHWFHGDCVVLWLKEHNTCPICRAAIENKSQSAASPQRQRQGQGSGSGWRNSTGGSVPSASLFDLRFPGRFPGYSDTAGESSASASNAPQPTTDPSPTRPAADGSSSNYRRRQVRSPSENEQRLNAIRSATFSMGMPGDSGGNNNNNSNSRYRRNSLSPPSAGSQQQQQEQRRTVLHNARTRDPGPAEPSFWSFGSASADQERNQDGERDRTSGLFGDRSHRHSQRPGGGNGNNGEGDSSSGNSTSAPRSLANWLRGLGGSGSSSGNGNGDSRRH